MENERCVIIDWPQWVGTDHQNAPAIIERDLFNILTYFKRKYKLEYELEDALRCVTG
jgi:RIO kinase 2